MLGMNRSLRDGEFRGYELLILKPDDGRLVYEAHPSGQAPAEFASTHVSDTLLVFENPTHDFPQRFIFHRGDDDRLVITTTDMENKRQIVFDLRRVGED